MLWNSDFTKIVPEGAAGNQVQLGIFFEDDKGVIQWLGQTEGHERAYNPETAERNLIRQEAPTTEIRGYHLTFDKDIIIKKGNPNYEYFALLARLLPTGDNAKQRIYLADFRREEIGTSHHKYYAEMFMSTVTITSINETDGIISVSFAQDGDRTIGVMGRTDNSTSDDESTFTYGFTSSRQITITGIDVSKDEVEIAVGERARAAVSFSPLGCPYDFTAETSDKDIATVGRWNQSVDITGRGAGTATVTITSTANPSIKAEIEVTVT